MKPTVVAPVPGPVAPAGDAHVDAVTAVVVGPPAFVVGLAAGVLVELPQALASSATAPSAMALRRNRDMDDGLSLVRGFTVT